MSPKLAILIIIYFDRCAKNYKHYLR